MPIAKRPRFSPKIDQYADQLDASRLLDDRLKASIAFAEDELIPYIATVLFSQYTGNSVCCELDMSRFESNVNFDLATAHVFHIMKVFGWKCEVDRNCQTNDNPTPRTFYTFCMRQQADQ